MRIAVTEPGAVSHYREAGVNFLLMDTADLQIKTGLSSRVSLSCLGGETGR